MRARRKEVSHSHFPDILQALAQALLLRIRQIFRLLGRPQAY